MTGRDLLAELNPNQAEAAAHFEGPALVIAGAGSGKTRTLIYRIAHLIQARGVEPGQILAVTFTNKAAAEMRLRASHLITGSERLWMSTFHSAGVRILRAYGEYIGLGRGFVIYDDDDQLDVLKEIMGSLPGIGPDTHPRVLRGIVDRAKSNLRTPGDLDRNPEPYISGLPREAAAEGFRRYEARKKAQNAIDFGDLITETVRLFQEVPGVLAKVQDRARFIHVDEYQDTNKAQYELTRLLASRDRNLLVVGDPDQCLPPGTMICTPSGERAIETLAEGETVCGTGGSQNLSTGQITYVKRGHYDGPLWQVEAGSSTLRGTPHHIVLARHEPMAGQWYVYLMHREDRGYRVGLTMGARVNSEGQTDYGYRVRLNQEHGDKVWVLRICDSRAEASYWEALYAARYGLPTALFHGVGRNLAMNEELLSRLFRELDTATGARRLMSDLHLHPEFPHHRPQNGLRRQSVNLIMFSDFRHGLVGYHRIQWSSNREDVAARLLAAGHQVRGNGKGRGGYRLEISRKDYTEALELAQQLAHDGGLELQRKACVGGQMYSFQPLSHLHPGMKVLVQTEGQLSEASVSSVSQEQYSGPVYDLTISPLHTYIANGLLVHNSIYKFRGADIQNILDFQKDYQDAKVYKLEHNYRSSARVLGLANILIENNTERLEKTLKAVKEDGLPVMFHRANDHRGEGDFVAEWVTRLHGEGQPFAKMAILYRTNAQSRVIEESLRRVSIPAKIVGGVGFYDRREIRDILAYARLSINPADDVALRRIIGRPKRGIGDTALDKLLSWAQMNGASMLTACANAEAVLERGAAKASEFAALMGTFAEAAENYLPGPFLKFLIESSGYLDLLRQEGQEGQVRLENLEELVSAAQEWSEENEGGIAEFLDDAALLSSVDDMRTKIENKDAPEDAVTLMTLHNAKGLEFPSVFIVGVEEGLLPSRNSLNEAGGIEEERRLFYVGITRAMDRLFLSAAQNRMQYGKTNSAEDSRFLEELGGGFDTVDTFGRVVDYKQKTWRDFRPDSAVARLSTPSAVKNTSPLTGELAYRGGEKVKHPKFGEGQVLAVAGVGERQEVTVHFGTAGTKKLIVKFANLSPA
ncbi:UvrD-helicase domain-containing protein [Deinococcus sp.]|uniref:UvrD-helicase domain-containing protein n=1 Tax=Deinococcus sp. TaxID=47478 RepID=UPI0025ECF646|nr:UvrD-helicase domain-containing protein [Deinococcus sp.]